ncbi:MAG TPA: site-specific integrase [Gemmataceae bacterium]|nr:site-specific integrase [Gemmataceae bacterium]
MLQDLIATLSTPLASLPQAIMPTLFAAAGEDIARRYVEFFTAEHRNPNTRAAYVQAVRKFTIWTERQELRFFDPSPVHVAAYIEHLSRELAAPSVKQHLAAIRMLFDYLVRGGACRHNPVTSVRGPKHVVKEGKTPVPTTDEALLGPGNRACDPAADREKPVRPCRACPEPRGTRYAVPFCGRHYRVGFNLLREQDERLRVVEAAS